MSTVRRTGRISVPELKARKGGEPIVCLTAYTTPVARRLDPHVDLLMVGDSLGMVLYGFDSTLPVTLDMMIAHGAAVRRGSERACLVVDLPFGSYQESPTVAYRAAARLMAETGCSAVKLEGGLEMASTVAFLVERGIPVMGHVGLTPQAIHALGSFRAQGRREEEWAAIEADAAAVAEAGAFAVVLEAMAEPLAARITRAVAIPTIGIGASAVCDGQILVLEDMLGLSPRVPKFVKRYAELGGAIEDAVASYALEVRSRAFPAESNVYHLAKSKPG